MRAAAILIGLLALAPTSGKNDEPQWLAPLTGGGAPGCSKRLGMRQYRSDVIRYRESTIFIEGEAQHARGCQEAARVQWRRGGVTKTFQLTDVFEQNFMIVDFAPDSSRVLIESEAPLRVGDEYFRNIQISTIEFSSTKIDWKNTWDLFGWGECEATVEPQGFTDEGEVVVRARPSVMARPRRPNCLKDVGLYAVDLQLGSVTRLPNDLRIQRYGKLVQGPSHTCESDPDLVDACFTVHGRLSFYNGNPTARIWRIGTKRILGTDDVLPGSLGLKMDFGVEAYGDFYICPFTPERRGEMRFVCVESAKNVIYKDYREGQKNSIQ